jgi:hypothetical protein
LHKEEFAYLETNTNLFGLNAINGNNVVITPEQDQGRVVYSQESMLRGSRNDV